MSKPILAGYDPRAADRAPVRFGVAAARFTGAPLIVAAVEVGGPLSAVQRLQASGHVDEDLLADCTRAVEEVEAELRSADVEVECRKLQGTSAARALQRVAEGEDAGLLVLGSSGESAVGRVLAGTTALRLLHGAPCPVAVVPQGWEGDGAPGTIGAAYVDTPEGREALHGAHALARRAGAKLRVITVVKHTEGMHFETDPPIPWLLHKREVVDVEGEHRLEAERRLREEVEKLSGDVQVEVEALIGDPADVIVEFSKGVDLLVCGSRGYGPARAVLLGSVSRRVMDEAHCPVIMLPRGVEATLEALLAEAPGAAAPA
jgi:nucleotide-binding universal stress UspA family protein